MLDLLPVLSYSVSKWYLVFCCLEVNMRLSASAQKFLWEDKDPLSAVCLDPWEYLQEHPLLLQALWHILAESCILLFYFHYCQEAFHRIAVELPGFVTTQHCSSPDQATSRSTACPPCVLIWKTDFVTRNRGNLQEHKAVATKFQQTLCPPLLLKQHGVNNCRQIGV